jgi:hypothetical protein
MYANIILFANLLLSFSPVKALVSNSLLYKAGDTTCSDSVIQIIRYESQYCTIEEMAGCSQAPEYKNSTIMTSTKTVCTNSYNDPFPIPPNKPYAVISTHPLSGDCKGSPMGNVNALLADGNCYQNGPSYFKAACSVGGNISSWICSDSSCQNCSVNFSGVDNECIGGQYKHSCVIYSSDTKKNSNTQISPNAAPVISICKVLYLALLTAIAFA